MTAAPSQRFDGRQKDRAPRRVELAKLFEKLPPNAIEAEMALIGSMILDADVCGDVMRIVKSADDFYRPAHRLIYQTILDRYDEKAKAGVDMVQIDQILRDKGVSEEIGGTDYLVQLAESVPNALTAPYYAEIVREKATLRKLIETAGTIVHDAYNSDEEARELLDRAEREIFEIADGSSQTDASELSVLLHETYERLEAHDGRMVTGLETGFFELDEMLNGLQKGEMVIVAARPSMGKTAFALNIAEHIAATNHEAVAVFSLEMSKQQLAQRMLCSRSGVDSNKLRKNLLSRDDFATLAHTVGELSDAPLLIDDTPGLTLLGLRAKARRLAARHGIKAIFIDYLQLMSQGGKVESRQQEVSNISRGVKALARELNVPVVCLSQLNRSAEQREGHRPRMSDLRESGSIEQDADVIMMLHREDYFHRGEDDHVDNNIAEVIVNKQRNGPTGTVKLHFDGSTTRFNNLAAGHSDGGY